MEQVLCSDTCEVLGVCKAECWAAGFCWLISSLFDWGFTPSRVHVLSPYFEDAESIAGVCTRGFNVSGHPSNGSASSLE